MQQVRVIVERLARRCGYDAVADAMPPGDKKLLSHIRKENVRKQRLRTSEAGSQVQDAPCTVAGLVDQEQTVCMATNSGGAHCEGVCWHARFHKLHLKEESLT
jgi:hypothetical protein